MKTYKEVAAEIERLKAKAESLRKSELAGVVTRIKEAIEAYGLTAADLGLAVGPAAKRSGGARAAASAASSVGVAKYRDPASGKTWTGRGKPPLWIKGAKDRSAFLIDGTAVSSSDDSEKRPKARGRGKASASKFGVPKYRDGATGKTWTGRGKPPNWIANAKDRSAFLIDQSASAS